MGKRLIKFGKLKSSEENHESHHKGKAVHLESITVNGSSDDIIKDVKKGLDNIIEAVQSQSFRSFDDADTLYIPVVVIVNNTDLLADSEDSPAVSSMVASLQGMIDDNNYRLSHPLGTKVVSAGTRYFYDYGYEGAQTGDPSTSDKNVVGPDWKFPYRWNNPNTGEEEIKLVTHADIHTPNIQLRLVTRIKKSVLDPMSAKSGITAEDLDVDISDLITSHNGDDYFDLGASPGILFFNGEKWEGIDVKYTGIYKVINSMALDSSVEYSYLTSSNRSGLDFTKYSDRDSIDYLQIAVKGLDNDFHAVMNPFGNPSSILQGVSPFRINIEPSSALVPHELGHNFGLRHAFDTSASFFSMFQHFPLFIHRLTADLVPPYNYTTKSVYKTQAENDLLYRKEVRDGLVLEDTLTDEELDILNLDIGNFEIDTAAMSEVDTGNFEELTPEEKFHAEMYFNTAVKEYTNNFTIKATMGDGSETTVPAGAYSPHPDINKAGFKQLPSTKYARAVTSGNFDGFWGGSYVKVPSPTSPQVGDPYEGGIIFYIDESGQHGLVAAMEDLGQFEWDCNGTSISGADGTAIGTGYQNSLDIVAGCSETNTAAYMSLNATTEGYTDWYLPSRDELVEMYNTIGNGGAEGNIGGFANNNYWSSSEDDNNFAGYVNFSSGVSSYFYKYSTYLVRIIRSVTFGTNKLALNVKELVIPQLGDSYGGGIVGNIGDTHMWILSEIIGLDEEEPDVSTLPWGNPEVAVDDVTYGTALSTTDGLNNTNAIIGANPSSIGGYDIAALQVVEHTGGGFTDWYLPAATELEDIQTNLVQKYGAGYLYQDTLVDDYTRMWTSTESSYYSSKAMIVQGYSGSASGAVDKIDYTVTISANGYQYDKMAIVGVRKILLSSIPPEDYVLKFKGPDITNRVPFCKLVEDTDPESATYGEQIAGTEYDVFWKINYNFLDPAYPAYPDNTLLEDVYSEELCPCLYAVQTFTSMGETYTYTLMGDNIDLESFYGDGGYLSKAKDLFDILFDEDVIIYSDKTLFSDTLNSTSSSSSVGHEIRPATGYNVSNQGIGYVGLSNYLYNPNTFEDNVVFPSYGHPLYVLECFYAGFQGNQDVPHQLRIDPVKTFSHLTSEMSEADAEMFISAMSNETLNTSGVEDFRFNSVSFNTYLNLDDIDEGGEYYNYLRESGITTHPYTGERLEFFSKKEDISNGWEDQNTSIAKGSGPFLNNKIFKWGLYTNPKFYQVMDYGKFGSSVLFNKAQISAMRSMYKTGIGFYGRAQNNVTVNSLSSLDYTTLTGNSDAQEYIDRMAAALYAYNTPEGYVSGCMNTGDYNYNPEATYACAECCIPIVSGCQEEWADNYNNWYSSENGYSGMEYPSLSFGKDYPQDIVLETDLNINTSASTLETGGCFKVGCTDSDATTDYYHGFDYEATINNPDLCVHEVFPRKPINKVICSIGSDAYSNAENYPVCNFVEIITGDGSEENPYTIETVTISSIASAYGGTDLNSMTNLVGSIEDILEEATGISQAYVNRVNNMFLIGGGLNCVENPVLPDGSGGCHFILHAPSQVCTYPDITANTLHGCSDAVIFEGGVASPSDIISPIDAIGFTSGTCPENITYNYIVGNNFNEIDVESTELDIVSGAENLPPLSEDQCAEYASLGLPGCGGVRSSASRPQSMPTFSRNITNVMYELLYTITSNLYIGHVILADGLVYTYNITTEESGERLYTRNEILRLGGPLIAEEVYTKKFHSITTKVINLINFTD